MDELSRKAEEAARRAEEATQESKRQDIREFLGEYGELPNSLQERIAQETETAVLTKWVKLAARADSIAEFMEKIDR